MTTEQNQYDSEYSRIYDLYNKGEVDKETYKAIRDKHFFEQIKIMDARKARLESQS